MITTSLCPSKNDKAYKCHLRPKDPCCLVHFQMKRLEQTSGTAWEDFLLKSGPSWYYRIRPTSFSSPTPIGKTLMMFSNNNNRAKVTIIILNPARLWRERMGLIFDLWAIKILKMGHLRDQSGVQANVVCWVLEKQSEDIVVQGQMGQVIKFLFSRLLQYGVKVSCQSRPWLCQSRTHTHMFSIMQNSKKPIWYIKDEEDHFRSPSLPSNE